MSVNSVFHDHPVWLPQYKRDFNRSTFEKFEFECRFPSRRGADDFGSSSSHEKSKIEVQKMDKIVKPNVSPNKKKDDGDDGDGDGDGDPAKKKKGKEDEVS